MKILRRTILPVLLVLLALVLIYMPVAWLLISSVSTRAELLSTPIHWIPQAPTFKNYIDILSPSQGVSEVARTFRITLGNSLLVAGSVTLDRAGAGFRWRPMRSCGCACRSGRDCWWASWARA